MALSGKQIEALADAHAEQGRKGLERSGLSWSSDRSYARYHDHRTITSLVDRGLLRLYVKRTVAHITDIGVMALEDALEDTRSKQPQAMRKKA